MTPSGIEPDTFRFVAQRLNHCVTAQWRTQEFCSGGGVQQIQLKTKERENGDLGAVAP